MANDFVKIQHMFPNLDTMGRKIRNRFEFQQLKIPAEHMLVCSH